MTAPATFTAAAPLRFMDPACRALLAYEAADVAFNWHVQTGQGDGAQLLAARNVAYSNYINASRRNKECAA